MMYIRQMWTSKWVLGGGNTNSCEKNYNLTTTTMGVLPN